MKDSLAIALKQLVEFLDKCEREFGLQYYIVGGILVPIYSTFRTTQDIDFVVDLPSKKISLQEYIKLLETNNFFPLQDWKSVEEFARETKLLQYFDQQEYIKLDNYIIDREDKSKFKKIGPLGLERKVKEKIFDIECWIESKEDYIISKLVFGGWQDYTDALGCWLRFNKELNTDYLKKISEELDIQKEYALLVSGIDDPDEYFRKLNDY